MKRRSLRLSLFLFWAVSISFFAVNVQAESASNLANIGAKNYRVGIDKVEKVAVSGRNSAISNQPQDGKELELLARQRYAAGEFAEAAKYWQQAVSAFEVKGDWLNQAIALSNLSLTYQQFGRWEEANSAIAKSLSLLPLESKATSPAELKAIAQTLDIQANGQWEQGQVNLALKTAQQATNIYVKLKDDLGWKRSLIAQVKTLQELGLYEQACQALIPVVEVENPGLFAIPDKPCEQFSQKIVNQKEATLRLPLDASLNNLQLTGNRLLGDVFRQLGYLQKSQDLLEKVDRVITQEKYPQAKALVLLSLGNTYQAFGNRNRFLADSQENNQKDYYQLATDSYRKAVDAAADASLVKVQAQLNLLSLLVDSKRGVGVNLKEAKELRLQILFQLSQLSKLLPSRQIIYAEISLVKSLVSLKNAELKTASNLANSQAEKTEKLSNYCLLNSSIVPESVAESVSVNTEAVSWREIVELGAKAVKLARELGDLRATAYALGTLGGVYEENQQWFEAQKCTEKALLVSQNVQLNSPDIAYQWQWQLGRIRWHREAKDIPGAIAAYTAAFNTLQSVRNDLVPISRDGQFDFRDRIEPVYRELVDLLLQGEEPSPDNLKQARNVIEALQVAELDNFFRDACVPIKTKQIDGIDRTAAVIYPIILEDRLEVIVSLPNQLLRHRSSDAPRKKVEDFVKKLQDELSEAGERAEVPKLSKIFYEWLIEPFNKYLKQYPDLKTLVFVLDGSLRNIPMSVLYDYDEITQKGNYLIENYVIAVAPGLQLISPNFWQAERLKVLIAGLSEERQFPGRTPFPALKYVEQELGNIQKEVPSSEKPLINQDFLKNSLKNQINSLRSSVVHIATHGEFSSEPEQTFIVAYDDVIQSKELSDILSGRRASEGSSIELLVLSGCKTAKGDPRAVLGLAGVAVRSGARSTLATLWYVDDESTAELMVQFYNELKKPNVSKAEALRQAQLSLLAKQPDSYYWAPFVMLGNWL